MQILRKVEKIIKKKVVVHIAYDSKMHSSNEKMSLRQVSILLERSMHFYEKFLNAD